MWGLALICERSHAQALPGGREPPIVVTAQRRPEQAKNVPISLTVRSGDELERMQATDTPALGKVVPSLVMNRTGPFTQPYVRGVGKRSTLGVENSVATYVDGVYLASPITALQDLRGIERIEVLNGPQGTLFGRNATGGVIQIVTRDPGADTSGEGELQLGSYGMMRADAYLSGGSDRLAANMAVTVSRHGGYGKNVFTGKTSQGKLDHSLAARSKWVWRPGGSLKVTVAGDYQDFEQDFMQLPAAGYPAIGAPRVDGFRNGDQDAPNRYRFRYGGVSARVDVDLAGARFMSLTALRRMRARYGVDLDLGPTLLISASAVAEQDQFSQEFQLQSSEATRLRWVAGLYYIHLDEQYDPTRFRYGGSYSAQRGGRTAQALFARGTASSYAAYAQGTLSVDEATALTAGLRYTIEHRSVRASGQQEFDNAPFIRHIPGLPLLNEKPFRNEDRFAELTWRASIDRHLSDEVMTYLAASRGFQSGGWNLQTPQNPAFGPERLDDFEAGLKFGDRSGRFSADANLFYYDYSRMQVSAITPIGNATVNAASANAYGFEMQLGARLGQGTNLNMGAQWLRTRFNRFRNATCTDYSAAAPIPYAPIVCDVTGNRLPFAPRLKLNAGVSQDVSLHAAGGLVLSANVAHNSGYFSEPDNVVRQEGFTTLDAAVEWRPVEKGPWVRISALNLTDAHYSDSLVTFPTTGVLQRPAAPRRFAASAGYSF